VSLRGGINNGAVAQRERGGAQGTMGRKGGFGQMRAEERRERKWRRRKTMILNKGVLNRRTVGWRNRVVDRELIIEG
jgi:hypothetical protein